MSVRFDKFTVKAQEAVQASQEIADKHNHQSIQPEHLLAALLDQEGGIITPILRKLGVDPGFVSQQVETEIARWRRILEKLGQINMLADEEYTIDAAQLREFPMGTQVWESACLACHDTHAVEGSRRLLREGTDSLAQPKQGGNPAIEETCYACHSTPK